MFCPANNKAGAESNGSVAEDSLGSNDDKTLPVPPPLSQKTIDDGEDRSLISGGLNDGARRLLSCISPQIMKKEEEGGSMRSDSPAAQDLITHCTVKTGEESMTNNIMAGKVNHAAAILFGTANKCTLEEGAGETRQTGLITMLQISQGWRRSFCG